MINESKIPSDWKVYKLSELANVQMGQSPDGDTYNSDGNGVPFVQGNADLGEINPIVRIFTTNPKKFSEPNDILLTVRAPVGAMNLNDKHIAIGRGIAAICEFDKSNYLYHYLLHNQRLMQRLEQGTTFTEINQREIKRLEIIAPISIEERKEITESISKVDEAIVATKNSIAKAERLKKALMQNLLTGKLKPDGTWRKEDEYYKDEKFGNVPIGWEVDLFGKRVKVQYGKSQKDIVSELGTIPIYGTGGIMEYGTKALFSNKSILIGRKGTIDRPYFIDTPFWAVDTTYYVEHFKDGDMKFLFYSLQRKNLKSLNEATGVPSLTRRTLNRQVILFPPLNEQIEIVKKIEQIEMIENSKQTKVKKLERLKKALMQNLLTGKVRVKVSNELTK